LGALAFAYFFFKHAAAPAATAVMSKVSAVVSAPKAAVTKLEGRVKELEAKAGIVHPAPPAPPAA
jgi:hypothetical protein